jgi:hypothetical protein
MDNFLKILAGIFAMLFIATTVLAFALTSVEQSAFDTELYIRALEQENVYQRLPELTAHALAIAAQRPSSNILLSLFKNLSEEQWQAFVVELFPPEVLRNLAEEAVTQSIAYLNGERENAVLSLSDLKAHLQSPEGINAIYGLLKAQPDCTLEQLSAMALNQQALTLCNPPDTFLFIDLRPIITTELQGAISLLPEQVTIISADESRVQTLRDLQVVRLFMRLSPLMPVMCLLLVSILAVRSLRGWLAWWGYPLLLAGLASMSLSALSGLLAAGTFQLLIAPALPNAIPPEIVGVFRNLIATIVRNALRPTLLIAGIMALAGLILVVLSFLVRARPQKARLYTR